MRTNWCLRTLVCAMVVVLGCSMLVAAEEGEQQDRRTKMRDLWRQISQIDGQLRAKRNAALQADEGLRKMQQEFEEKLAAKIVEMSPESKELFEKKKALTEQMNKLRPSPAEMEARRKKFADLRKKAGELDEKLNPVRQKLMAEDEEVKDMQKQLTAAQAHLQELVNKKMAEAAPDMAEVVEQRMALQKEMQKLWGGRRRR